MQMRQILFASNTTENNSTSYQTLSTTASSKNSTSTILTQEIIPEWNGHIELNNKEFHRIKYRKVRKANKRYSPQNGDLLDRITLAFEYLKGVKADTEYRSILKHLERAGCLLVLLMEVSSVKGYVAALTQYISSYLDESVAEYATYYVKELMNDLYTPQSSSTDWMVYLKDMRDNWKTFLKAPIFSHISKVLSIAVSLGLCNLTKSTFNFRGVQLFASLCEKKHMSAMDIVEALLNTAVFFIEAGYDALRTGSILPFVLTKETLSPMDELYFKTKGAMKVLASGNLELAEVKDENDLIYLIDQGIKDYGALLAACKDPLQRIPLERRYSEFREWKIQFLAKTAGGGLREAPFSIFLKGPPGIGKSVMTSTFMTSILKYNGFEAGQDRIATINLGDKYMSNYKSSINGVVADDIGQGSPKYETGNPARVLIDIINNTISYANKAEIENKGMVVIRPKVFIGNANTEYMGFSEYLTCPSAGMRRGIHLEITLKPAVSTDGKFDKDKFETFMLTLDDSVDKICPDIYLFNLFTYKMGEHITSTVKVPFVHNGVVMKNITYRTCMEVILAESRVHFQNQKKLVEDLNRQPRIIEMCPCGKLNYLCSCQPCGPQYGERFIQTGNIMYHHLSNSICDLSSRITNCMIPFPRYLTYLWNLSEIIRNFKRLGILYFFTTVLSILAGPLLGIILFSVSTALCVVVFRFILQHQVTRLNNMRGALVSQLTYRPLLIGSSIALTICSIYSLYKAYQVFHPQGNLAPTTMADIEARDKEQNIWAQVRQERLPVSIQSSSITPSDLENTIKKNMLLCLRKDTTTTKVCNAFMVRSGYILLPMHMIPEQLADFQFMRYSKDTLGSSFFQKLCLKDVVRIADMDMVLAYVPNCGDWRDLSGFLQLQEHTNFVGSMVYLTPDGLNHVTRGFKCQKGKINNTICVSDGYTYVLSVPTFSGMCMGVIIAERASPSICGLHIGGIVDSGKGCAAIITKASFDKALEVFSSRIGIMTPHSSGTFRTTIFQNDRFLTDLSKKSPVHFMPTAASSITVFGGAIGAATYFSEVRQSITAKAVTEICKFSKEFSGPKFFLGKQIWRNHLITTSCPAIGPNSSLLSKAATDYYNTLVPCFETYRGILRPLNQIETVNGMDGVRFIDRMNLKASVGFPNTGAKRNIVIPGKNDTVNFPDAIWTEIESLEKIYLTGERVYPIFKGCLKDEPKSVDSVKVRVFQASPLELQLLIRKYFLPVVRVLSLFPLESECAVGINSVSKEWEQLDDHIMKYGAERVIAGDYSGYDTRMSAISNCAAFDLLLRFARDFGAYTQDELTIMRGIATDVIYPCMAMNGDLIQLFGSTPSGHNLTLYTNSINNSLLLRCGFFSIYPEATSFNQSVAVTTYGDDFKGTVHKDYCDFNFLSYQSYLASTGSVLTHPDKKTIGEKFLGGNVDFLKRQTVYIPEIECKVGALAEESILRSLKVHIPSPFVVPEQGAADNIDGALREWFFHGKEIYETRRAEMRLVAERCNILERVRTIDETFENKVIQWKDKNLVSIDPDLDIEC